MSHSTLGCVRSLVPVLLAALLFDSATAATPPPPIDAFARMPAIRNVAISPDGQQLLFITGVEDSEAVVTIPATFDAARR
ncbi:MAG TPA: hypothetical protein VGD45_23015 [Steroidobacter sp.]|uniref:hypothetical protein n=1 Tax=Steroidobacter sp. TaxID=1978227 RepID=UPI002ED8DAEE